MKVLSQHTLARYLVTAFAVGAATVAVVGCGGGGGCASAEACATSTTTAATTTTTTQPTASAVSVGIGTNGLLATATEELQYSKDYVVTVSDVNGYPVAGATVIPSVKILNYAKGYWVRDASFKVISSVRLECANEDLNGNSNLDPGEDTNGDGKITPAQALATVTMRNGAVTDAKGAVIVSVAYPKSHATWLNVKLTAKAAVQSSEGSASMTLYAGAIAGDEQQPGAPFIASPFGVDTSTCANAL